MENIDVRTADPFVTSILSDYKATSTIKVLDEDIFRDIYEKINGIKSNLVT